MYWKATLYELPGVEKIDLPVDREYYGYVDEEVYLFEIIRKANLNTPR